MSELDLNLDFQFDLTKQTIPRLCPGMGDRPNESSHRFTLPFLYEDGPMQNLSEASIARPSRVYS